MKCDVCGAQIKDDAKFCPYCGAKQPEVKEQIPESDGQEPKAVVEDPDVDVEDDVIVEDSETVVETDKDPIEEEADRDTSDQELLVDEAEKKITEETTPVEEISEFEQNASAVEESVDEISSSEESAPVDEHIDDSRSTSREKVVHHLRSLTQLKAYLIDPVASAHLDMVPAVGVLIVSCLANMWLVYSALAAILKVFLTPMAQYLGRNVNVASYMSQFGYGYSTFFINGLMMTAVTYAFLLVVTFFSARDRSDLKAIASQAAGYMVIPTVLTLTSCIFLQFSLDFGMLMFIAAVSSYIVILLARLRSNMNIYFKILVITVFFLLLVLLLSSSVSLNTLVRF